MTETSTKGPPTHEGTGSLEQVRVPAWEAKYKLSETPEELAHMVCCRDLEWRQAFCGYIEEEPTLMYEADNICTMCVETAATRGWVMESRLCPIDNQECPPEDEVDRMIAERASRT